MSRTHSTLSKELLIKIQQSLTLAELFRSFSVEHERKTIYDALFRLRQQELIVCDFSKEQSLVAITPEGAALLGRVQPIKDGVWKIVIFDIPEKKRAIRNHLRSKLKALGFQKWQESIWISPFALDPDIEAEFSELSKKFFIRLIRTTQINNTEDLEKMF